MANTPNYALYKPNRADTNVEVDTTLADNFTKIDTELKANKDSLDTHKNNPSAHDSTNISHADGSVKTTLDNHETRISQTTTNINTLVLPSITAVSDRVDEIETLGLDKLAPNLEGRISTIESDVDGILAPATFDAIKNQSYTFDEYRIGYVDHKLSDFSLNVKLFGAKGDGVTDDSQAVNNAIASIKTSGGTVYFPPGTYIVAGIGIFSKVHLKGSGVESTVLKLKNNANQDVIYSDSVYTLMGTGSTGGENNFSISDLTIDGNRTNNPTAGNGINLYGYDYTIQSVRVRNCSMKGFISEWGQWGTPGPNGNMEAHIQDFKVSNCGTEGIDFAGPHDSQFVNVVVNNCNKQGWGASGILVRGNGSATFTNTHVWGVEHEVAFKLEGIAHLVNCQGEGARSNVVILVNDCTVVGGYYYGFNPGEVAFVIGSSTQTVSGTMINTKVTNCQGGVINFVNDYSGSYTLKAFSATTYATPKGILGTVNANSYLFLMNEAPNGANIHKLPSGYTTTV